MRRVLKVGILMGGGGFLILSALILKYSDAQDVFPQIRFVGILCVAVLFFCGFAAWDNFQVAKKLRKELGECGELAQWHEGIEIRTARELLVLRFREKAFLCVLLAILPVCIDSYALPFLVWSILSVSILLCLFAVIISMFNDCRRLDEIHASSECNGLRDATVAETTSSKER